MALGQGTKKLSTVAFLLAATTGLSGCGVGSMFQGSSAADLPTVNPLGGATVQTGSAIGPDAGLFGSNQAIPGQAIPGQGFPGVDLAAYQQAGINTPLAFGQPGLPQQGIAGFHSIPGVQTLGTQTPGAPVPFANGLFPQPDFPAQGLLPNAVAGFQQAAPQYQVSGAAWGQPPVQQFQAPLQPQVQAAFAPTAPIPNAPISAGPFDPYAFVANQYQRQTGPAQLPLPYPQSVATPHIQGPQFQTPQFQSQGFSPANPAIAAQHAADHAQSKPQGFGQQHSIASFGAAPSLNQSALNQSFSNLPTAPYPQATVTQQQVPQTQIAASFGPQTRPTAQAFCADLGELSSTIGSALSRIGVAPQYLQNQNGIQFEIPFKETAGGKSVANAEFVMPTIAGIVSSYPTLFVQVIGHTRKTGRDTLELSYTDTLASYIGKQIIDSGVESDRVQTRGFGSRRPSDFGNDDRAEFRITMAKNCSPQRIAIREQREAKVSAFQQTSTTHPTAAQQQLQTQNAAFSQLLAQRQAIETQYQAQLAQQQQAHVQHKTQAPQFMPAPVALAPGQIGHSQPNHGYTPSMYTQANSYTVSGFANPQSQPATPSQFSTQPQLQVQPRVQPQILGQLPVANQ